MKKFQITLLLAFSLVAFTTRVSAQSNNATSSPYSNFGVGELKFRGYNLNTSLGGLGQGISDPHQLNFQNPASLSQNHLTTFEAAVQSTFTTLSNTQASEKTNNTSLNYLALALPFTEKLSMAVSLMPYSNLGYKILSTEHVDSVGRVNYIYQGSGGLNIVNLAMGYALNKKLSLGINASYIFGTLHKQRNIEFPDEKQPFNLRVTNTTRPNGFRIGGGFQYAIDLKKYTLVIGGSVNVKSSLHTVKTQVNERYKIVGGVSEVVRDSVAQEEDQYGTTVLPMEWALGIGIKNQKIMAGIDFKTQQWSQYSELGVKEKSFVDASTLAAGIQYTPNIDAVRNYFNLVRYRFGAHFENSRLSIDGTRLKEYGLTAGLGLPVKKVQTLINLSVEYGVFGTHENSLIKEDYVRVHIGFTFNDKWFVRRKIE